MADRPKLSLFRSNMAETRPQPAATTPASLPQASPTGRTVPATVTDGVGTPPADQTLRFRVGDENGGSRVLDRPATIEGFKRRAKKLKKTTGITHGEALEQVAHTCGFKNYDRALGFYRRAEVQA